MAYTKKQKAAAHLVIANMRNMDAMLAGEIHTDDGVLITDGIVLTLGPGSFDESKPLATGERVAVAGGGRCLIL